jgi:hypothetical protein
MEDSKNKEELEKLHKVLSIVAFIHHKFTTTQFYAEEFESVKQSLEWLQNFATELDSTILSLDPELKKKVEDSEKSKKVKEEVVSE